MGALCDVIGGGSLYENKESKIQNFSFMQYDNLGIQKAQKTVKTVRSDKKSGGGPHFSANARLQSAAERDAGNGACPPRAARGPDGRRVRPHHRRAERPYKPNV